MKPDERRQAIIDILCQNGHETMKNLASEFGVSIRTICYDIAVSPVTILSHWNTSGFCSSSTQSRRDIPSSALRTNTAAGSH